MPVEPEVLSDGAEFFKWHPGAEAILKEYAPNLTPHQVLAVGAFIINTCHECWEGESGCQCWNDE